MKPLSTKPLNKRQELILNYIAKGKNAFSVAEILALVRKEGNEIARITVVRDLGLLTKINFRITHPTPEQRIKKIESLEIKK